MSLVRVVVCVCVYLFVCVCRMCIHIFIYNVYLYGFLPSCVCVYTYIYSLLQGTGSLHTYLFFSHGLHAIVISCTRPRTQYCFCHSYDKLLNRIFFFFFSSISLPNFITRCARYYFSYCNADARRGQLDHDS